MKIFLLPSLLNMIIESIGWQVRGLVVGGRLVGSHWVSGCWIYYKPLLDSRSFKIVSKFYLPHPAHLTSRSFCFSSIFIDYQSMSFDRQVKNIFWSNFYIQQFGLLIVIIDEVHSYYIRELPHIYMNTMFTLLGDRYVENFLHNQLPTFQQYLGIHQASIVLLLSDHGSGS